MRLLGRGLVARLALVLLAIMSATVVGAVWVTASVEQRFDLSAHEQRLAADSAIVTALGEYGRAHATWDDVGSEVAALERTHGLDIVVVEDGGEQVGDDGTMLGEPVAIEGGTRIDPAAEVVLDDDMRVVTAVAGPFALSVDERASLADAAAAIARCRGGDARVVTMPSGRPVVVGGSGDCGAVPEAVTEAEALEAIGVAAAGCLAAADAPSAVTAVLLPDDDAAPEHVLQLVGPDGQPALERQDGACLLEAWRLQAVASIAPAIEVATLTPSADRASPFDLSPGSWARIALLAAGVLGMALLVLAIVIAPLVRRTRAMAGAAGALAAGDLSVRVDDRGTDEMAALATAFNEMAARLRRAQESRDRLTRDIAHELRNPLTNIRGWIEAAQDGHVADDEQVLDIVGGEAAHLQRIVDDLDTLARSEDGTLPMLVTPIDVTTTVDALVAAHAAAAAAADVVLTRRAPAAAIALADERRLRQVLDNLVTNALRHADASSVTIAVAARATSIEIVVRDDGSGIAPEALPHIFDRFWLADPARARSTAGSGLGLAIAAGLMEAMGGSIAVESEPGAGTAFVVGVPAQP